jgi:hypothetical protein
MDWFWFQVGFISLLAILVVGVLAILWRNAGIARQAGVVAAGNPAAPVPATTRWYGNYVWIWVAVTILGGLLIFFFLPLLAESGKSAGKAMSDLDYEFWGVLIVAATLLVASLMRRAPAWISGFFGLIVIAALMFFLVLGDRAGEVKRHVRNEMVESIKGTRKVITTTSPDILVQRTVKVTDRWSKPLNMGGDGYCFRWWGTTPEDDAKVLARTRLVNSTEWLDYNDVVARIKKGERLLLEWIIFSSKGGEADVTYYIRRCS